MNLLLLIACGDRPLESLADPTQVVEAARKRPLPSAMRAGFSIHIEAPTLDLSGTTRGSVVIQRPDKLRFDVISPFGTPLAYAATDGTQVALAVVAKNRWLGSADGEAALRELTGGSAGIADVVALVCGQLPFADAPVLAVEEGEGVVNVRLGGPQGSEATAVIDRRDLTTRRIEARDPKGSTVLVADYQDYQRLRRTRLPDEVSITAPGVDFLLELNFDDWEDLGRAPDVFTLPVPAGTVVEDLGTLAQEKLAPGG